MFNFKLMAAMVREFPGLSVYYSEENYVYLEGDGLKALFNKDGTFSCSWQNGGRSYIEMSDAGIKPHFTGIPTEVPTKEDVDKLEKMSKLISRITGYEYPKKELDLIRNRIKKERVTEALKRAIPEMKESYGGMETGIYGVRVAFHANETMTLDITNKAYDHLAGATAKNGLIAVDFNPSVPMTRDTYEKLCKVITIFSTELELPYPRQRMEDAYDHMLASIEKERNQAVEALKAAVLDFFIRKDHTRVESLRKKVDAAIGIGMERSALMAICLSVLSERILKSCVTTDEKGCAHMAFCEIINL